MFEEGWWDKRGPLSLSPSLFPSLSGTVHTPAHKQVWVQCPLELP